MNTKFRPSFAAKHDSLIRVSHEGILSQLKAPKRSGEQDGGARSNVAPQGYEIVSADGYVIAPRDLVFIGGSQPRWVMARRAGEAGELVRFSTAAAVARPRM